MIESRKFEGGHFILWILPSIATIFLFFCSELTVYRVLSGIVILLLSSIFMHKLIEMFDIKKLSIPGFFYLTYIFIIFLPSIFVYAEKKALPADKFFFSTISVLVTFPLGVAFTNYILGFKKKEISNYYSKPITKDLPINSYKTLSLIFLTPAICLMSIFIFENLVKTGSAPIISLIFGTQDYFDLIIQRENSLKLLNSPLRYFYILLRDSYFPLIIVFFLTIYLVYKSKNYFLFISIAFILALIYSVFTIAKAPVAIIFFLVLLCYYLYKSGQVSKIYLAISPVIVFAFPIFVVRMIFGYAENERGFFDAIVGLWSRIFLRPAYGLYNFFEIFPYEMDFVYGRTIGKLTYILGREPLDLNTILVNHAYNSDALKLKSLNMSGGFIGYFNADFGLIGVIVLCFFTGIFLQSIQIYFLRKKKTPARFASFVFLTYSTIFFNLTSVPNTMLQRGMLIALVFPFGIGCVKDLLSRCRRKSNDKET
jgi:oligosaccharide repeat unit polymerase